MKFNFNFISDLHADFYRTNADIFVDDIMPIEKHDVLIVAGDHSNYNFRTLEIFEVFKKRWKEVLFCLGNHDYYLTASSEYPTSEMRALSVIETLTSIGCRWLGGDVFDVSGVRIGGSHAWYDGAYARLRYGMTEDGIYALWKNTLNDSRLIKGFDVFKSGVFEEQFQKLYKIKDKVDIMVTHVPPIVCLPGLPQQFQNPVTGFFSFCGDKLFAPNIKAWIFGHTHLQYDFLHENIRFMANPLGYPSENSSCRIQSTTIEI